MSLEPFPLNNNDQDDLESPRLFPFVGSDKAYIAFLENQFINPQWTGFMGFDKSLVNGATIDEVSQADGLEIVQYAPGLSHSKVSETAVPRWKKELFTFISALPTEGNWQESREKAGINEPHKNWLALRWLLGYPNTPTPHTVEAPATRVPVLHTEDQALVLRGHYYAEFMQHCTNDISFTTSVVSFQSHLMRRYFSRKNDDQTLEGYRRGSVWVNRCASELLVHGWGHKSWELFLLGKPALRFPSQATFNKIFGRNTLVGSICPVRRQRRTELWIFSSAIRKGRRALTARGLDPILHSLHCTLFGRRDRRVWHHLHKRK